MPKYKKYDYRVVPDNACWAAEIIRRVTSKDFVVSKSQGGFATEPEAQEWGQTELKVFLQKLVERNKRHTRK